MLKKQLLWILLGITGLVLGLLLRAFPQATEDVYGRGIFIGIRWMLSMILGYLPLPGVTLLFIGCLFLFWKTALKPAFKRKWSWLSMAGGVLSTVGAAVFLFQFLWGFNYARPAWDKRLGIEVAGMTAEQLTQEYHRATEELKMAMSVIQDVTALDLRTKREHELSVANELRAVLNEHNFPLSARPRVRIVRPKGILMRWNTAGIYVPFSGEGHVDAGMLPVQIPFTLAHEMAHGYGVTDEGDCNFLAYLTCNESEDPYVRFAGLFTYWRYAASEFRYVFPDEYKKEFEQLPDLIKTLLVAIHENDAKYPDLFPKLRNKVYDTYLKSQGVQEGLQSYNRVVQLVWAYEMKYGNK